LPDEVDDLGGGARKPAPSEENLVVESAPALPVKASAGGTERSARREEGKDAPLWLGSLETREPARLEPIELTRHVAVFGASGSGKTYLAKSIVEEAILAGVPVLAFDVQGDILTLAKPLEDDELDGALHRRRDDYSAKADVRLLTPMSDAGLRISLNPLRFPSHEMGVEAATVYSEAVADNLLAHVKLPPSWRDHARQYVAARIRSAMKKVPSLAIEDLIAGIAADEDVDDSLLDGAQREKLVKQLRLLTVGTTSLLFKLGKPFDLDALLTPSEPNKTPLNIIWLNGLGDQQNKESFVAMVLADLYGWMLRQKGGAPRVLLYFDEVGPYMPPHGEPPSKKLLKRVFKEGRKYGVCGLFCTQNFTDVDYKVVSQANTVAIGRLNASQEKKKAADSLGSPPNFDVHRAVDQLMFANSGRFIVKRIDGPPHWLQGRKLLTQHGRTWGEEEIKAHTPESQRQAWGG
ncbi:MAG TPA: ATP-binding protein, partial [Labilithrix sp.]|nr:ATP-binding protein [Labilithrix sp.]